MLTSGLVIVLSLMPAKLSLYREKKSDIEFFLDSPKYARHR
jgi:hypothetical protein